MAGFDRPAPRFFARHPRAIATGACAELADRLALPVWLVRVPVIVLFVQFACTVGILYVAAAIALRTRLIDLLPPRQPAPPPGAFSAATFGAGFRGAAHDPGYPPSDLAHGAARERFAALEARLARMEAAVISDELKLRARFRDIEG